MLRRFFIAVFVFQAFLGTCAGVMPVPFRPDPPITVDGLLGDWETVPFSHEIASKDHVVWKQEYSQWASAHDLSGIVRLAWRPEGLYIAAQVKDDVFRNSGPGRGMFKGDHIELFIDTCPDDEPERKKFGVGQFQLAISPGDLNDTRPEDAFGRINPEVYQYHPAAKSIVNALVASQKTADGWNIEALIGWDELGVSKPAKDNRLGVEVVFSDSDSEQIMQEKMMTISTDAWKLKDRGRLIASALADSEGNVSEVVKARKEKPVLICGSAVIAPQSSIEKNFVMPKVPEGYFAVLFVRSRLQSTKNNGDTPAMTLAINGKGVTGENLLNKTTEMKSTDGTMIKIFTKANGFRVPYASSYKEANLHFSAGNRYARFVSNEPRTDFKFDVTELLHEGKNILKIGNLHPNIKTSMHVADIEISFESQKEKTKIKELQRASQYYFPTRTTSERIRFKILKRNAIEVPVGQISHIVRSSFSIPGGKWVNKSNRYFSLKRTVTQRDGVLEVKDRFTNLTDKNLGIMQRHEVDVQDKNAKYYLNGILRPFGLRGYYRSGNGTSFVELSAGWIGMLAINDAFRIHAKNYLLSKGGIGLCDPNLVIGPGSSYTAEWVIVPGEKGDYWDFINTLRRFLDVNFKIDGSGACSQTYKNANATKWTVEKFQTFFENKSAFYGISALTTRSIYKGKKLDYLWNHGNAMLQADMTSTEECYKKWRQAVPDMKILGYFHCFIDSGDNTDKLCPDDKILNISGKQVTYGRYYYPLFYPTLTNKFGKTIEPIIDMYFDKLKTDGIFWDEMSRSNVDYHYGFPWDQCSGDIDLKTHDVVALKSSVSLITKPWRLKLAKKILQKGYLVGNGVPACREIRELKFPCFSETAQSTFATKQHLYSPVILGDHLSEVSEVDSYRSMLAGLDYGCVYYWYSDKVIPTHKTLTSKMFPITPVQLGAGFIIGKERIITKISGFFGWGDASEHEVFFFDENGIPVSGQKVTTKMVDGNRFSEINLWPDWSAVIVKK